MYVYTFIHTQRFLVPPLSMYVQIDSKDFIDDLHPIYGLYTLGDEDVLEHKPHAPQYECDVVATDLLDK
jgi:hypothetical protein